MSVIALHFERSDKTVAEHLIQRQPGSKVVDCLFTTGPAMAEMTDSTGVSFISVVGSVVGIDG